MAKVLKVDSFTSGDDCFVYKTFTAEDEVWFTFEQRFTNTPDSFQSGYAGDLGSLGFGAGFSGKWSYQEYANVGPFIDDWVSDYIPAGYSGPFDNMAPTPTPDTWDLIELHYHKATVVDLFVNGTSVLTGSISDTSQITRAIMGQRFGGCVVYFRNAKIGTTRGGMDIFADDFSSGDISSWTGSSDELAFHGTWSVIDDPFVFAPTLTSPPPRFEWRFAITKLNLRILDILDGVATQRQVTYTLNKAAVATGVVPSDNKAVNLVQSDGFRILDEGVRCLIGFRRESDVAPKWVPRFAGLILQVEDNVDENGGVAPYSTYTAYDPRQLLYSRPVRNADGSLPGPNGLTFTSTRGNTIALDLLARSLAADGEHYIETTSGHIENTDIIGGPYNFQQGSSIGDAFDQLAKDGYLDIILEALYDPVGFPNKLATFNCYKLAGYNLDGSPNVKHKAPLAWDKPRRNLVGVNRLKDGTQRANKIQYYSGAGGPPVGVESNFAAVAQYGEYWAQQFFPGASTVAVQELAGEQLAIRAKGVKTYKMNLVPGSLGQIDSPILFFDYELGSLLPIFASGRFRKKIAVAKRVISIPVVIRDDGVESITQMEFGEGEEEVS